MTSMLISQELVLVEDTLRQAISSNVGLLAQAGEHILRSGGKRLRPQVVLLSYKALGGQDIERAVPLAASVELLHTASLVHDDINDRSALRRGQTTINAEWGDSLALLAGDFIFVKLFSLIAYFDVRAVRILASACVDMVEGETLQMLTLGDLNMAEQTYLDIVGRKTASLFRACGELAALLAQSPEHSQALQDYGYNVGMAFQIRDDTLDLTGKEQELGKPVANDLEQGKMSLATIEALKRSAPFRKALRAGDIPDVLRLLRETGALDSAMQTAENYSEAAKRALEALPPSPARDDLCALADFARARCL